MWPPHTPYSHPDLQNFIEHQSFKHFYAILFDFYLTFNSMLHHDTIIDDLVQDCSIPVHLQ